MLRPGANNRCALRKINFPMSNSLLISVAACDVRVALVEDGRLAEFYLESQAARRPTGNIYKGRVLQAPAGHGRGLRGISAWSGPPISLPRTPAPGRMNFTASGSRDEPADGLGQASPRPPSATWSTRARRSWCRCCGDPWGPKAPASPPTSPWQAITWCSLPPWPNWGSPGASPRSRAPAPADFLEELRAPEGGFIARTASRGQSAEKLKRERDLLIGSLAADPAQERLGLGPGPAPSGNGDRLCGWCGNSSPRRSTGSWWMTRRPLRRSRTTWSP